jgi:hypothetical protein
LSKEVVEDLKSLFSQTVRRNYLSQNFIESDGFLLKLRVSLEPRLPGGERQFVDDVHLERVGFVSF